MLLLQMVCFSAFTVLCGWCACCRVCMFMSVTVCVCAVLLVVVIVDFARVANLQPSQQSALAQSEPVHSPQSNTSANGSLSADPANDPQTVTGNQIPTGSGAKLWNPDWWTKVSEPKQRQRVEWLLLVNDGKGARCTWCSETKQTGPWATNGCFHRKLSVIEEHEDSKSHERAAAEIQSRKNNLHSLVSAQDQKVFTAFESNFDILYFIQRHRVRIDTVH